MNQIFLIGIIESLFFGFILLVRKNKTKADRVLLFWLLLFSIHLVFPFFVYKDFPKNIYLSGTDGGILVLHPILLFVYSSSLLSRNKKIVARKGLHLAVFFISCLLILPYAFIKKETKIGFYENTAELPAYVWLASFIINVVFLSYIIATIRLISKHVRSLKNEFSFLERLDLNWLKYLTIGLLVFYISLTIVGSILYALNISIYNIDFYIYCLLVVFVFGIGFYGIKQQNVFSDFKIMHEKFSIESVQKKNNAPAIISDKDNKFTKYLQEFMVSEKPHLNNELSLYDLADKLHVKAHYLSHILNNVLKTNFYEFVNYYRVEELKKQLQENKQKFSILGLAFESGFNSKSTANRIFKNYTGKTPSQYINSN